MMNTESRIIPPAMGPPINQVNLMVLLDHQTMCQVPLIPRALQIDEK
ncbi:hypothetical protein [Gimesia chilikensis]|uniref:Uncharacterized protein n=1 Tax=Gimesia chilikensis TaxID=2605989 RepID=A0A517PWD9_9PLAN|nr:hypothetical protein [Gimesia chilikensis]QDT23681.1 hypothetical protein HG66A1_55030 [Gimesia chilikensis]|tara:strand:+ start:2171 stop:2311 length:141 start_codon:yes stop_codon:yes gene_type:complete